MRRAGLAVAVADAVSEIREVSHYITKRSGGRGAVGEMIELILKSQGRWESSILPLSTRTLGLTLGKLSSPSDKILADAIQDF